MKKIIKKIFQNLDMILILSLFIIVLYQVIIEFNFIMHKSYCIDYYKGRQAQFEQCLADYNKIKQ